MLVGNVLFLLALLVSLSSPSGAMTVGRAQEAAGIDIRNRHSERSSSSVLTLTVSKSFLKRWLAP